MTSKSSKAIPFVVLFMAGCMFAVEMFTEFVITDNMIQLASIILAPMGVGGLLKKAWEIHKNAKSRIGEISDEEKTKLREILTKLG